MKPINCFFFQDASPEIVQLIQKLEKERDSRNFTSPKPQKNTVLHRFHIFIMIFELQSFAIFIRHNKL